MYFCWLKIKPSSYLGCLHVSNWHLRAYELYPLHLLWLKSHRKSNKWKKENCCGLPSSFWPPRNIFQLLFGWMLLASTLISVFADLTSVNSLAASPLTKLLSLDKSTQGPFETHDLLGRKLVTFLV